MRPSVASGPRARNLCRSPTLPRPCSIFFFFNDPPPPDISPLPLHDALPFGVRPPPLSPAVQHRPHAGVSPRLVAADSLSLHRPATRPAVGPAGRAGVGGRVCLSRARKTAAGGGREPAGPQPAWSGPLPLRARPAAARGRRFLPRPRPAPVR